MTAGLNIGHNHSCFKPTISVLKTKNIGAVLRTDTLASGHSKEPQGFSLGVTHDLMTLDHAVVPGLPFRICVLFIYN